MTLTRARKIADDTNKDRFTTTALVTARTIISREGTGNKGKDALRWCVLASNIDRRHAAERAS